MGKGNEIKSKKIYFLCSTVKELIRIGDYQDAFKIVYESIAQFPDNPEPHNLLGILLEKKGEHALAMKHFRVAWVLDPTYKPANQNLLNFGDFYSCSKYVYDEDDCPKEKTSLYHIIYDDKHIGHVVKTRIKN